MDFEKLTKEQIKKGEMVDKAHKEIIDIFEKYQLKHNLELVDIAFIIATITKDFKTAFNSKFPSINVDDLLKL